MAHRYEHLRSGRLQNACALHATVAIVLLTGGCRKVQEPKTVVDFWAMGAEGERALPLIAELGAILARAID